MADFFQGRVSHSLVPSVVSAFNTQCLADRLLTFWRAPLPQVQPAFFFVIVFWVSAPSTNWYSRQRRHVDATGTAWTWTMLTAGNLTGILRCRHSHVHCWVLTTQSSPSASSLISFWQLHLSGTVPPDSNVVGSQNIDDWLKLWTRK